jgi:hypothetical protein
MSSARRLQVRETILKQLIQGEKQFWVPLWQRQYTWRLADPACCGETSWSSTCGPADGTAGQSGHFLGSMHPLGYCSRCREPGRRSGDLADAVKIVGYSVRSAAQPPNPCLPAGPRVKPSAPRSATPDLFKEMKVDTSADGLLGEEISAAVIPQPV